MCRNPDVFEDPNTFRPERFEATTTNETQNPFSYIPFSAGPRNCIGQKFAVLEIKSILSKLLRNYEFHLSKDNGEEPILSSELILRPESSINFKILPRIY